MRRILTLLLLAAACADARAQRLDPDNYIYPILQESRLCSANFGELRPGHFHAGVDIKTDGVEGKPLVAVADGYVSRLSVAAGGYGRAIYLTLRNGTTAVYGHLQRFRDDIEEHVRKERFARRSNSVNLWFEPGVWPVKQGDVIGYSGNSGSSGGPHLHFEIRDTPTQRLHNLVREGVIRPEDNLPPRIMRVHYVEIDTLDGVPVRSTPESYAVVRESEGHYRLTRSEPVEVGRKGYFIAEVTDRRNGVYNTFGVWRVTASIDGRPYFEYRMDGFTHDLSRCCDAVSCYPLQIASRNEAIRLAQLAGSPDTFYPVMEERGLVRTEAGEKRLLRIEAEDDSGNRSSLEFPIAGRAESFRAVPDPTATALFPGENTVVGVGPEARIRIQPGSLYEPLFVRPERLDMPQGSPGVVVLSPAYRFLEATTPLREPALVTIRAQVPRQLRLRTVLAGRSRKGGLYHVGGTYSNGAVTAVTRTTGDLVVVADTLAPTIRPLFTEGVDLTKTATLRFHVGDNFSGITTWTLRIDGEWVPCDRFPMKGTLVHTFDTPATRRRHTAELTVRDGCGNTARYTGTFVR